MLCTLCFFTLQSRGTSSSELPTKTMDEVIEFIISNSEKTNVDPSVLYEDLYYYMHHPLNINQATEEQLQALHILTDFQIASLIQYRETYGNILEIQEIRYIQGFDKSLAVYLLPFISIGHQPAKKKQLHPSTIMNYSTHKIFLKTRRTLESQKGYMINDPQKRQYLGNPGKLYTRYRMHHKKDFSFGFTAEKDPGEPFFKGNNKYGFDYYSSHLYLQTNGFINTIAAGDYQLHFGQGLILNSGLSFDKSPYIMNIKKYSKGIRRYSSTAENKFMRGLATTLRSGNLELSLFFSQKQKDANIDFDASQNQDINQITGLQSSGLHNTKGLMKDKNAVRERLAGTHINYQHKYFQIGATWLYNAYNAHFQPSDKLYKKFAFTGQTLHNTGINYQTAALGNIIFFGETAITDGEGLGTVNGILMKWAPRIKTSLLYRYYEAKHFSFYGNAFSESTSSTNEEGWYAGIRLNPLKNWKITAYWDVYRFPWLNYRINAPETGHDYFVQVTFSPQKELKIYGRLQQENKPQDTDLESIPLPYPVNKKKLRCRYHISYQLTDQWELRNRFQWVRIRKEDRKENGYLIYQDILYDFSSLPLSLCFRYGIFDTESYASRIYAYENNIMYSFSVPAYHNKGSRLYLLTTYEWNETLRIGLRYAQSYYPRQKTIGSGLNQIEGQSKTDLHLQIRCTF